MFKINYYRLFVLIALFSNSSNVACSSSFQQSDNHNNLNSVYPHTNPPRFVSHIPIHNKTNCDSLPNGLLPINTSNMQQGATHPLAMRSLVLNGPNYINVNNNNILFSIPYAWNLNATTNTLFGANNNTVLPSILPNAIDTSTNMNNVVAPMPLLENPESTIPFSTHTNNNKMLLLMPDEPSSSNTTSSVRSHINQDKQPALSEKKKKKKKSTKAFTCPTCNKSLANKNPLNYHLNTEDPNRARPYKCHLCPKKFAEKSILKIDISRHNNEKPLLCNFCSKRFRTKWERTLHHRSHTGEKPFRCTLCDRHFAVKAVLKSHMKTHTGEKPYQCSLCNRCFARRDTLNIHIRTHTGEKLFKCNICQKGLASKVSLRDHLNKHKGKKPHKCTQCTRAYATKSGLRAHVKTHSRLKLYICHYCNASFAFKGEYEKHIRYEEETNDDLKCHLCKKVYTDKFSLTRHNKKVHPINS